MSFYYFCFFIFILLGYFIVTDNSVARLFLIITNFIRVQYEKTKWIILNDPRNPIVKYLMWRRAYKLAEEIQNEIKMERQSRGSNNDCKID